MPREGQFFELFNRHCGYVVEGSVSLQRLMSEYDDLDTRKHLLLEIDRVEKSADRVTDETISLLHRTFITPFDREVIHALISRLDDILDMIQDVAESATLYDLQRTTAETRQLAELTQMGCERVASAVGMLDNMDNASAILRLCQEIDQIESDADRVMRSAMSRLFREESDVRQLIKLKAVYELLESVTDRCEDVAKLIEGVVLENA
jgi:predicted phosphate transport protein (TIGR00153 family)